MLEINSEAPDFNLPDADGKMHNLGEYKGRWLVLYFYPKDQTPGCTAEACSFRDNYGELKKANIEIVGINGDSVNSHKKFTEKHSLPFTLLADADKTTVEVYGAKGFFTKRITYLINPEGRIAKAYPKVSPSEHATQILKDVAELAK